MSDQIRRFLIGKMTEYGLPPATDDVILATKVAETGLDSLDLMELLTDIEEHFDIRVEDDTVSSTTTVADLVDFIARKSKGGSA